MPPSSLSFASAVHWPTSDTAQTTSVAVVRMGGSGPPAGAAGAAGGSALHGLARMSARQTTVLPRPLQKERAHACERDTHTAKAVAQRHQHAHFLAQEAAAQHVGLLERDAAHHLAVERLGAVRQRALHPQRLARAALLGVDAEAQRLALVRPQLHSQARRLRRLRPLLRLDRVQQAGQRAGARVAMRGALHRAPGVRVGVERVAVGAPQRLERVTQRIAGLVVVVQAVLPAPRQRRGGVRVGAEEGCARRLHTAGARRRGRAPKREQAQRQHARHALVLAWLALVIRVRVDRRDVAQQRGALKVRRLPALMARHRRRRAVRPLDGRSAEHFCEHVARRVARPRVLRVLARRDGVAVRVGDGAGRAVRRPQRRHVQHRLQRGRVPSGSGARDAHHARMAPFRGGIKRRMLMAEAHLAP